MRNAARRRTTSSAVAVKHHLANAWLSRQALGTVLVKSRSQPRGDGFGAEIEMDDLMRPDAWLFGESQSRILVSLRRKHLSRLRDLAEEGEVPLKVLGEVRGSRLRVGRLIDMDLSDMRDVWAHALRRRMEA